MSLMPTCREVHQLTSEGLDRPLTLAERVSVHLHLLICEACAAFTDQMNLLRGAMRRFEIPAEPPAAEAPTELPPIAPGKPKQ